MAPGISVVIPLCNEQRNVPELFRRLEAVLNRLRQNYEIIFIDDGSTDSTLSLLVELVRQKRQVKIISLSRNFGHEAAVTAGLDHSTGRVVILMDGDLQDLPEFIPQLLAKINDGYDVVYAQHRERHDPFLRKTLFGLFYRIINHLASPKIPLGAGAFSVMRRPVVDVLCSLSERNRYVAGLRAWVGFKQCALPYEKQARFAGRPPQTMGKLFRMGLDAAFSFSYVPLRMATFLGLVISFFAFLAILNVLYQKLVAGTAILGWASPLISILFIGGVQLVILGILGEYLGRIYDEVKHRPYYIVSQKIGFS